MFFGTEVVNIGPTTSSIRTFPYGSFSLLSVDYALALTQADVGLDLMYVH